MSDHLSIQIHEALLAEVRRRLIEESTRRIIRCLEKLDTTQIWQRPNASSNSIGNLVLHLCGNVRQYILTGIDGQADMRRRSAEFSEAGPIAREALIEQLEQLMREVEEALQRIRPEYLIEIRPVQCFEESVMSILVHVVEHFSYHTGQIVFYTKALLNEDMAFYAGLSLDDTT